jgi:nucleotide-binding universal stress UspA family protein
MFQHCLICTDFSDGLQRFASFISNLSRTGISKFIFLHTVSVWEDERIANIDSNKLEQSKAYLQSLIKEVPAEVEVKIEVSSVRYLDQIHQLIKREAIDLILTGMPVRSDLENKLFGSHTLSLAKSTEVPVMILRPQLISTYTSEELSLRCQHLWQHLLVPFDDSAAGRYVINCLKQRLEKSSDHAVQSCRFLWVVEDAARRPEVMALRQSEAQKKLNELEAEFSPLIPQVSTEIRLGNPLPEILDAAFVNDISAIAVGSFRANLLDWTVPSLTDNILGRSWFPLLFFSPKG